MTTLLPIEDKNKLKRELVASIAGLTSEDQKLGFFLKRLGEKGEFYFVGGFIRDFINQKSSRDIDVISVASSDSIQGLLNSLHIPYIKNRHNGYKLSFSFIEMDLWSISDNWAFTNKFVKSDPNEVRSISRGSFYNFDSLVFAFISQNLSVEYYNSCVTTKTLDILQKNNKYQGRNPTREANILRAFYIHDKYGLVFSQNLNDYIYEHLNYFDRKYGNMVDRLWEFLFKYPKYRTVLDRNILLKNCVQVLEKDPRIVRPSGTK